MHSVVDGGRAPSSAAAVVPHAGAALALGQQEQGEEDGAVLRTRELSPLWCDGGRRHPFRRRRRRSGRARCPLCATRRRRWATCAASTTQGRRAGLAAPLPARRLQRVLRPPSQTARATPPQGRTAPSSSACLGATGAARHHAAGAAQGAERQEHAALEWSTPRTSPIDAAIFMPCGAVIFMPPLRAMNKSFLGV